MERERIVKRKRSGATAVSPSSSRLSCCRGGQSSRTVLLWTLLVLVVKYDARRHFIEARSVSASNAGLIKGTPVQSQRRLPWTILSTSSSNPLTRQDATPLATVESTTSLLQSLRGGSSTAASKKDNVQQYRLQQQLYLQSRSFQLRQALLQRGLDELQHGERESQEVAKPVDWDCAIATPEHPKSCLYSFDAEVGAKVIAPIDTQQWITLTSLNRLRRTDPTKVEPLWHSQYTILASWLRPDSQYSLYTHLSPLGACLSLLLDAPILLGLAMATVLGILWIVTLPLWERLVQVLLTSKLLWMQWPNWGRFVHASLPLKLLLGQMAFKAVSVAFGKVYQVIRDYLIEWECQIWQDSIPLTILEGVEEEESDDFGGLLMDEGDDEEDDDYEE